jgi:hypothetical protein
MIETSFTRKVVVERSGDCATNNVLPSVRRQRRVRMVMLVLLLSIAGIATYGFRRPILRAAGWMLLVNDPIEPADVIVVTVEADGAGVLEAADLVHSGVAARVAVFGESPDTVEREFIRRGIPYDDTAARSVHQLKLLGLDTIGLVPTYVVGSEDEGPALAEWCDHYKLRSVVVVSTSDHSRRLHRVLHRSMKGHLTRVTIRYSRYSVFDPDRWWQSHVGIRTEVAELEKLLRDVVRHPIS